MKARSLSWAARVPMAAVLLVALSACATPTATGSSEAPSVRSSDASAVDGSELLDCIGAQVPRSALVERRPATELGPEAAPALDGYDVAAIVENPADWFIGTERADRDVLLRQLAAPDDFGAGDIRDFELVIISTDGMFDPPDTEWMVVQVSRCALHRALGELWFAAIELDPSSFHGVEATELSLLVTEFSCNSGNDASGRIEVVELRETETAVEIAIGVRPAAEDGAQSCQGNPQTPFTVELDRPLGDRAIVNSAVVPARTLLVARNG
jgi:hypothetical protein